MYSKALLSVTIFAFLFQANAAAAFQNGERNTIRQRSRFAKEAKEAKDTKEPKEPKAKATKSPKDVTKAPKKSKSPKGPTTAPVTASPTTAAPVPTAAIIPSAPTVLSADSTKSPTSNSTDEGILFNATLLDDSGNVTLNCTMDDDCDDGWFCMERAQRCCEFNTTCLFFEITSGATASQNNIITAIVSGMIFFITLW